jgi:hypothetical protein
VALFNCWKAAAYFVPDLTENIDMKRLVTVFLLSAAGILLTASNVTTEDVQDVMGQNVVPRHVATLSPRGMKSAEWNGDGMSAPLTNATGHLRSLEDLLEVFTPQRLARRWYSAHQDMTEGCEAHLHEYLSHHEKGVLWALKSEYCSPKCLISIATAVSYVTLHQAQTEFKRFIFKKITGTWGPPSLLSNVHQGPFPWG